MSWTILVVDDEAAQRDALAGFLKKKGHNPKTAETGEEAFQKIKNETIDLVLTDMRMPGMDGQELLKNIKQLNPDIDVIVMTAYGNVESATQAMKNGAADFITKPIDLEQLELAMAKTLERKQLISENKRLREMADERLQFGGIISKSSAMAKALSVAARVAPSRATVLILGESGTGKELVARAIHYASPRRDEPFVAVNIAALSDNLVESELFGHEKGAFTGADRQRQGRFEMAHQGTLFIDEVADIPLNTQAKLLRVLQEQRIERLGSSGSIEVDVRVITATNRPLAKMVESGEFREDLYYRLNVVSIQLPPLRERRTDIPALAEHFRKKYSERHGKNVTAISREAMDQLMKYDYPGNVRELENMIEQAVVLSRDDVIARADLPGIAAGNKNYDDQAGLFQERVEAFEKNMIVDALRKSHGIQTRAAELLGISERHLRYKIKKYGLK